MGPEDYKNFAQSLEKEFGVPVTFAGMRKTDLSYQGTKGSIEGKAPEFNVTVNGKIHRCTGLEYDHVPETRQVPYLRERVRNRVNGFRAPIDERSDSSVSSIESAGGPGSGLPGTREELEELIRTVVNNRNLPVRMLKRGD